MNRRRGKGLRTSLEGKTSSFIAYSPALFLEMFLCLFLHSVVAFVAQCIFYLPRVYFVNCLMTNKEAQAVERSSTKEHLLVSIVICIQFRPPAFPTTYHVA